MLRNSIYIFLIVSLIVGCAPSRMVVPLGRKTQSVGLAAGGELIRFNGSVIPVPLSSIQYANGVGKHLTTFGAFHLTSALYGTYHLEVGMLNEWLFHQSKKWGLTSNLVGNFMLTHHDWKFRFYPQLDVNYYWHFMGDPHYHCDCPGDKSLMQFVYVGFSSWYELTKSKDHNVKVNTRVLLNPHLGYSIGNQKNKYALELKYIAPWFRNDNTVVSYYNPFFDYGVIGAYLSYNRVF